MSDLLAINSALIAHIRPCIGMQMSMSQIIKSNSPSWLMKISHSQTLVSTGSEQLPAIDLTLLCCAPVTGDSCSRFLLRILYFVSADGTHVSKT